MKEWSKGIEIYAPIEQIWELFDSSLENMQKVMPQVVDHQPSKVTDEVVGSVYRQKYREGKRIETYDVETLEYINKDDSKKLKVFFTLANMFEITTLYDLKKVDENKTFFTYTVTNRPIKWFVNIFLLFASEKEVVKFTNRVKGVAESE